MKIHKIGKKIIAFAGVLFSLFTCFTQALFTARADESVTIKDFDATTIEADLSGLGYLNSEQYPKDEDGTAKIVSFIEYCYGMDENYGLYMYVYNPQETLLVENVTGTISLGVNYGADGDASKYISPTFTFLDATDNNRFVKVKINSHLGEILASEKACAKLFDGARRYDIKAMRLYEQGKAVAVEVPVNKLYTFTGQANLTGNGTSSLQCRASERLYLDTHFANYRTEDYVGYVCDELQTVYFSVPKTYFDDYGFLQQITAEWDEYKTNPIFVTSDLDVYNGLYSHLGEDVYTEDANGKLVQKYTKDEMPWNVLWEEEGRDMSTTSIFNKSYNGFDTWYDGVELPEEGKMRRMDWLFYRNADVITSSKDYAVSKDKIVSHAEKYKPEDGSERYVTSRTGTKYHEYLFADEIDTDRKKLLTNAQFGAKRGHIKQTIDAGADTSLMKKTDKSWWDEFWFGASYEEQNYQPIVVFNDENHLSDSVDDFASEYLINDTQKQEVYNFCKTALANGEYPVLFRYAVTDYYTCSARFDKAGNNVISGVDGYVAQETVFLGFNIISLLFRSQNWDTLVSVASNPVDVFNGTDAPPGLGEDPFAQWWTNFWAQYKWYIIGAIIGIPLLIGLVVFIVKKGIAMLFKGIWLGIKWIFKGIWRGIKWIFKGIWLGIKYLFIGIGKFFGWIGKGIAKIFKRG